MYTAAGADAACTAELSDILRHSCACCYRSRSKCEALRHWCWSCSRSGNWGKRSPTGNGAAITAEAGAMYFIAGTGTASPAGSGTM